MCDSSTCTRQTLVVTGFARGFVLCLVRERAWPRHLTFPTGNLFCVFMGGGPLISVSTDSYDRHILFVPLLLRFSRVRFHLGTNGFTRSMQSRIVTILPECARHQQLHCKCQHFCKYRDTARSGYVTLVARPRNMMWTRDLCVLVACVSWGKMLCLILAGLS